jgi:hypothetical protein
MNRDNPANWREQWIIMDELAHYRIFADDKIVPVFLYHFCNGFGHLL